MNRVTHTTHTTHTTPIRLSRPVYQRNHHPGYAIIHRGDERRTRDGYRSLRRAIRRLRRHSPMHMDVLWYERSLGLDAHSTLPVVRHYGASALTGPVGRLP